MEEILKMVTYPYDQTLANDYAEARDKLNDLIESSERMKEMVEKVTSIKGKVDKKELMKRSIFGSNSDNTTVLFDLISQRGGRILPLLGELIEKLRLDTEQIKGFLGKVKYKTADAVAKLNQMLISHNQNETDLAHRLRNNLPEFIGDVEKVIVIENTKLQQASEMFKQEYDVLVDLICSEDVDIGHIYDAVSRLLKFLKHYVVEAEIYDRNPQNQLLEDLSGQSKIFAKNYFRKSPLGYEREMNELDSMKGNKSFASLEEKKEQKKIKKFLQKRLEELFIGIEEGPNSCKIKDKLKEIFGDKKKDDGGDGEKLSAEDFRELKDSFMNIIPYITERLVFNAPSAPEDLNSVKSSLLKFLDLLFEGEKNIEHEDGNYNCSKFSKVCKKISPSLENAKRDSGEWEALMSHTEKHYSQICNAEENQVSIFFDYLNKVLDLNNLN